MNVKGWTWQNRSNRRSWWIWRSTSNIINSESKEADEGEGLDESGVDGSNEIKGADETKHVDVDVGANESDEVKGVDESD